ncbi:hypothetical protein SCHPADRAFT_936039 [Schizopora paradoxa]|uniref:LIM zinc-binding domain-containing protein n=1 Tax=Schizopora paradoxa TaxID=27342 RepID=A0A0H2S2K2_9AGAM|nr:hypothetical protein SCHPADRAFT_936039 [Schizopora paradoxa]
MAQLAPPLKPERVSQILSSVKCSNCGNLVPADDLADHVCATTTPPSVPTPPSPARPSPSQAILAKIRMEAQRKSPSPPPAKTPPPPSPSPPATRAAPHHHQQASRSDAQVVVPSIPSVPSRTGTPIRSRTPVLPPPQGPPPPRPPPQTPLPPPLVIPSSGFPMHRQQSPAPRSPLTPRSAEGSTPPPMNASRAGTPAIRGPQQHQQPYQHQQNRSMQLTSPVAPPPRGHSPLSASPQGPPPNLSLNANMQRMRSPSSVSVPPSASAPQFPPPGTRDAPPSVIEARLNQVAPPPPPPTVNGEVNMAGVGRRAFQAAAHAAMLSASFGARPSGMQSPLNGHPQGQPPWGAAPDQLSESRIRTPPPGMDGRRNNAPRHLNIDSNMNGGMLQGRQSGHSLSPSTPHSLSPRSPLSHPGSPHAGPRIASSRTPSPLSAGFRDVQQVPPLPDKLPESHRLSPALPENIAQEIARSRSASPAGTVTGRKSPLAQRLNGVVANLGVDTSPLKVEKKPPVPPSPAESEGSDYGGLAYDNESGSGSPSLFSPTSPTASIRPPSTRVSQERKPPSRQTSLDRQPSNGSLIRFPTKGSPVASPGSPQSSKSLPLRSFSSSSSSSRSSSRSSTSSRYSRGTTRSTGALPPSLDTLFENPRPPPSPPAASSSSSHSSRSSRSSPAATSPPLPPPPPLPTKTAPPPLTRGATVSASATSPPLKSPKLPTRSRTAPSLSTPPHKHKNLDDSLHPERDERPRAISSNSATRPRQCSRCTTTITDARWIPIDIPPNTSAAHVASLSSGANGGVLCENCWKTMYLPKCRRCNHVIEKQAVSSADGQLKGKYHRECFTCCRCHKPFPDKEFYVYEGEPFCRYHYHEANKSLCAGCGQPIEGACAIAHSGERYHPEHLLCEFEFPLSSTGEKPKCREPLTEYWEVDGRMLCEKHAILMSGPDSTPSAGGNKGSDNLAADVDDRDEGRTPTPSQLRGIIQVNGVSLNGDAMPKDAADARRMRRKTQFIDLK